MKKVPIIYRKRGSRRFFFMTAPLHTRFNAFWEFIPVLNYWHGLVRAAVILEEETYEKRIYREDYGVGKF